LSHFVASITGVILLLLARALQRRVDVAYPLTVAMLIIGILTSLFKGLDYEEALVLAAMLAAFLPTRRHFYRHSSLLDQQLGARWIALIGTVLVCAAWLAFFSFKHVAYKSDLWWHFAYHADAPRFLRAAVGVCVVIFAFALTRLVHPARSRVEPPDPEELAIAARILEREPRTLPRLALLGDKMFLFNEEHTAFVTYSVQGKSWVALGGPVGPEEEQRELVWQFRDMVDRFGGWCVFHNVAPPQLPLYLDAGLSAMRFGESARVPLGDFAIADYKSLRQAVRHVEDEGLTFAVLPSSAVPALLPELRRVSDAWLTAKNTREKRFSMGFFDEAYLSKFPTAVVRRADRVVAFANVWEGAERVELSIDLMRHTDDAPNGVMDYLFARLMDWGRVQGYGWFDLGLAPLAGFEQHPLAPIWNRVGRFVFRHGEHFYNFQGLRQYKAKFHPVWEPRYLIYPGGLMLPRILLDCATLTSGGLRGIVTR
ncbi:MAG TPA: bifunctional lysylphosphatidylglycerol flippase/synthetase MprF, partial [Phycisphaerae bacterium]|nr:bifunctional lysylphosphatidylglycerol flippase/synthetase MprF [Phycisphaerae bacterium]